MTFEHTLKKDIFSILPYGGKFLSGAEIAKRVAPQRERGVRAILYALAKRGILTLNRGGGGWPWLYGRVGVERRV